MTTCPNLPFTWLVFLVIISANDQLIVIIFQAGTIEDVKSKAEQLAKEMGN